MGLFGRNASPTLLPFHQNSKLNNASDLPLSFLITRRGARLCERILLLIFCIVFVGVFGATLYYLPDISSTVNKVVARDFLVQDDLSHLPQIKKPRRPFPVLRTEKAKDDTSRNDIPSEDTKEAHLNQYSQTGEGNVGKRPLQPPSLSSSSDGEGETRKRKQKVVQMMKHAWDGYVKYAWGANELRPVSKRAHNPSIFGKAKFGATIVDAADTLYVMGLRDEFNQARDWIAENLNVSRSEGDVSVFEFNIRYIGGLLSAYALSGDKMLLTKADEMATAVLPAFDTPTGIPYAILNLKTKAMKNYNWASGASSILSEFGTLHLEWAYLSKVTGKPIFLEKVIRIRQHLCNIEKPKGLYPNYMSPETGKWGQLHVSMGALGDSFYEYLFKIWLWSGKTDSQAKEMFDKAMPPIEKYLLQTSKEGLTYFGNYLNNRLEHKMEHLACFSGGLYALSAPYAENPEHYMTVAKGLTNTCHESYSRTPLKLGPESFRFLPGEEAQTKRKEEKVYLLRPETFESYFVLWRTTKDPKYREWGWEAVQALETFCRAEAGYSGIKNVYEVNPMQDDVQQSYFLAETLKYLFLLFSDDDVLPLDQWVFNTEAHPVPVTRDFASPSSFNSSIGVQKSTTLDLVF